MEIPMDPIIKETIAAEEKRQRENLEMIASENYASREVLKAAGSVLMNKYAEGYPGKRYYAGNNIIDEVEKRAQELANDLFGTVHANVQPYSGSPANLAVSLTLAKPGETIMGQALSAGGHLTHGADASLTGKLFHSVGYGVGEDGKINLEEVASLAKKYKPKMIWVGTTAYPYLLNYELFAEIADQVGAFLVADISHIAGLIAGGEHPNPAQYVDLITSTTHKSLRGPRGAMILTTKKGLEKDSELAAKIDKTVFPGLQGGPHLNTITAIAVALHEASQPQFREYAQQIVRNAKALAGELDSYTENHLILKDLSDYGFGLGYQLQIALEMAGIITNRNTVPNDKASATYPSGIRLGTPALTSRGMKEEEMIKIAGWIQKVLEEIKGFDLPKDLHQRKFFIDDCRQKMQSNVALQEIKKEVTAFAVQYPVPGLSD